MNPKDKIAVVNAMSEGEFIKKCGAVFEHSPWVAERCARRRPFGDASELHAVMCDAVKCASPKEQLALIRAHPDLVGRAALTPASQGEQASAGLMQLTDEERGSFARFNAEYKARFDFPFVICARLNKKQAILEAFPRRLRNTAEQERAAALEEIFLIAKLRLLDLVE